MKFSTWRMAVVLLLSAPVLSGCASTVIGAGATVGMAAAQERGVRAALSDTWIQAQIVKRYFDTSEALLRQVGVEVVEGEVLLTGQVAAPEHQLDAVRLAWQVDGVKRVINEIEVADGGGLATTARDVWITTRIRTRLLLDGAVFAINYSIETIDGRVYVMGIAQDRAELDRVLAHIRDVSYVRDVVSYVRLRDDPERQQEPAM